MPVGDDLCKVQPEGRVAEPGGVFVEGEVWSQVDWVGSGRPRIRLEMMLFWISNEPP
jgi:hypothetical protein